VSSVPTLQKSGLAEPAIGRRSRLRPLGIGPLSALLGVVGTVVTTLGSWNPSFWGDEAASVMSAERPLATLWGELGRVDAVHGAYYVFLHFWIQLFGASEFAVRLPSAIAIGVALAGTVVLANMLLTRQIAIAAGIIFMVLPRVTLIGTEGRSYAMATALAVWSSVLLVTLLRRRVTRLLPWLAYGAVIALSIYVFLYLVLLAGIHLLVMLSTKGNRSLLRRWLAAAGLAVVLAGPVLAYGLTQHNQIAFLAKRNYATAQSVVVTQWFDSPFLAAAGWLLLVIGAVLVVRRHRADAVLLLGWFALPTAALMIGNSLVAPMYSTRYVSFCTPAVAIVMAVGLSLLSRNWMRVVAVAALVGLAVPSYLAERGQYAKNNSDFRQAAQVVAAHATHGDAVVFDETVKPSIKPRLAIHLYPEYFAGVADVTLKTPYSQLSGIWDSVSPITAAELGTTRTVWALEVAGAGVPADVLRLEGLGYTVTNQFPIHLTTVYELTRETP
jgi:mannosyltransferase